MSVHLSYRILSFTVSLIHSPFICPQIRFLSAEISINKSRSPTSWSPDSRIPHLRSIPVLVLIDVVLNLVEFMKRREVLHPRSDDNCGVGSDVKTELPTFL